MVKLEGQKITATKLFALSKCWQQNTPTQLLEFYCTLPAFAITILQIEKSQ